MTIINTYLTQTLPGRMARQSEIHLRCILLLRAVQAKGQTP